MSAQLNGRYKVRDPKISALHSAAREVIDRKNLKVRFVWVPRAENLAGKMFTEATFDILKRRLKKAKGPYLFPHRQDPNKPLTTVRKAHLDALKEAKIRPRFRLYDLRHTFGSRSAMAGVDLATRGLGIRESGSPYLFIGGTCFC